MHAGAECRDGGWVKDKNEFPEVVPSRVLRERELTYAATGVPG